jgi:tripartite-type tricarboxylate transporter receptor subunit TctC
MNCLRQGVALTLIAGCVLSGGVAVVAAQDYPSKPVRLVVPASPGGGLDIMARAVGQDLSVLWGQTVVVDNRPGAGIMIGTETVARASADGYTLLMVNSNIAPEDRANQQSSPTARRPQVGSAG